MKTDLATYNNSWYRPGSFFKRICWYVINELVLRNPFVTFSSVKVMVLKAFGARLGKNVVIKPR
ncbi:MAG TPA: hypothetical protein PKI08_05260, partial [Aquaticitalea sp.]|nr:hypothetical protein [Aquaticitalea sp.]